MRIPAEIIEEIKARNDIEEVVSSYVTLKRAGSNMMGLCPFHSEKTPSFNVSSARGIFKCFGCGSGGDVITFIMKIENLDYREAVELLAKRAGIRLPQDEEERKKGIDKRRFFRMNKDAALFFHSCFQNTEGGKAAYQYLLNRGLSRSLITHFGMGYAPDSFDALHNHLRSKGYTDMEMKTAFLCAESRKNGRTYDIFRKRVMIPIIDLTGNVIAFGGRVTDDSKPKYINTSDNPIYKKGRNIFALNFAKEGCGESLILCEGYMDVIALHGAGFSNAVACLGTAMTPEQARLIARYTKSVFISLDNDEAGKRAVDNAFNRLTEAGLEVKILGLSGAKDPDEYIKKYGKERFSQLLTGSRSWFDFKLNGILEGKDLSLTEDKVRATSEAVKLIAGFPSQSERDIYIGIASKKLDIPSAGLKNDVEFTHNKNRRAAEQDAGRKRMIQTARNGDKINPEFSKNVKAAAAEEAILGVLLRQSELIPLVQQGKIGLGEADFITEFNRAVFARMLDLYEEGERFDFGLLGQFFSADEMGRITDMATSRDKMTVNGETVLRDCIAVLKKEKNKNNMNVLDILEQKRKK